MRNVRRDDRVAASVKDIGISPDSVTRDVTLLPGTISGARHKNHEDAPIVGWPANGISPSMLKMSMFRLFGSPNGCLKLVSERVDSFA